MCKPFSPEILNFKNVTCCLFQLYLDILSIMCVFSLVSMFFQTTFFAQLNDK